MAALGRSLPRQQGREVDFRCGCETVSYAQIATFVKFGAVVFLLDVIGLTRTPTRTTSLCCSFDISNIR